MDHVGLMIWAYERGMSLLWWKMIFPHQRILKNTVKILK